MRIEKKLPLTVLESEAGFYIGTYSPEEGPISRESLEYWSTRGAAQNALNNDLRAQSPDGLGEHSRW